MLGNCNENEWPQFIDESMIQEIQAAMKQKEMYIEKSLHIQEEQHEINKMQATDNQSDKQ